MTALPENIRKEELSHAHLMAIAAFCGFATEFVRVDYDGIDVKICARGLIDGDEAAQCLSSPEISVQLKATAAEDAGDQTLPFRLRRENYDTLRVPRPMCPRILVVHFMPHESGDWLAHSEQELITRRCAYWMSLKDEPEIPGTQDRLTVRLPRGNVLTPDALHSMMVNAAYGRDLGHGL